MSAALRWEELLCSELESVVLQRTIRLGSTWPMTPPLERSVSDDRVD